MGLITDFLIMICYGLALIKASEKNGLNCLIALIKPFCMASCMDKKKIFLYYL